MTDEASTLSFQFPTLLISLADIVLSIHWFWWGTATRGNGESSV
jgi:hypothetical protein